MNAHRHPHQVVLLSSRFQYADRRLFFSRARLFPDRIELSGWNLGRKHAACLPLDQVDRIEWAPEQSAATFHSNDGSHVALKLDDFYRWRQSLEQRMHWYAPDRVPVGSRTFSTPLKDLSLYEVVAFSASMG